MSQLCLTDTGSCRRLRIRKQLCSTGFRSRKQIISPRLSFIHRYRKLWTAKIMHFMLISMNPCSSGSSHSSRERKPLPACPLRIENGLIYRHRKLLLLALFYAVCIIACTVLLLLSPLWNLPVLPTIGVERKIDIPAIGLFKLIFKTKSLTNAILNNVCFANVRIHC